MPAARRGFRGQVAIPLLLEPLERAEPGVLADRVEVLPNAQPYAPDHGAESEEGEDAQPV